LLKPGRDPRDNFQFVEYKEEVSALNDLKAGMILNGVVTNVTAFGAFVDVGVHQDGLVHISQLAERFVKNPVDVVHTGQLIEVRVLDVDVERCRISLSARLQPEDGSQKGDSSAPVSSGARVKDGTSKGKRKTTSPRKKDRLPAKKQGFRNNPFADLLG